MEPQHRDALQDRLEPTRAEAEAAMAELHAERLDCRIPWKDISAYEKGNTGIPYAFTFDSGNPGPHVVITGLCHGNEPAGREAVTNILDNDVRPRVGKLSICLLNVAAYHGSNGVDPYGTRFIDSDFNRIWSDEILDGEGDDTELRRGREVRPLIAAADVLFDVHSTPYEAAPFHLIYPGSNRGELIRNLSGPSTRIFFDPGSGSANRPTISCYRQFSDPSSDAMGISIESGLFFGAESAECGKTMALDILRHYGLIDEQTFRDMATWTEHRPERRLTVLYPQAVETTDIALMFRPESFRPYPREAIVGYDGDAPIRAPFDAAVPMWVKQRFEAGVQAFMWARIESGA